MSNPSIRVWLSHDGYRDADDNLAMLVGAAQARSEAKALGSNIRVAGVVFGDTKDGGQYYMLNPDGTAPASFGTDSRYGDVTGNRWAAGNYAFYQQYGKEALQDLGPGWKQFDLLAGDNGGLRAWNFSTPTRSISTAATAIVNDIKDAITQTAGAADPAKIVVYSAGGGANVAAEAIAYLERQGYNHDVLVKHFVVVQHGNNWVTNYEAAAREYTRDFTIAISNQNLDSYANGMDGPGLKNTIPSGVTPDASHLGADFNEALKVAIGAKAFANLPSDSIFRTTRDASDAGSHAFATDAQALLDALDRRLGTGEMRTGDAWAHLVDLGGNSTRLREIYNRFDPDDVAALLSRSGAGPLDPPSNLPSDPPSDGTVRTSIAAIHDDFESIKKGADNDLDFGRDGSGTQSVGLRFTGMEIAAGAEIASAYFVFTAAEASSGAASFTIDVEATTGALTYSKTSLPDGRSYLAADVDWAPGAWTKGETYRSADIAELVEAVIGDDGLGALDALAFRISGSGMRSATAFEAGTASDLVIVLA